MDKVKDLLEKYKGYRTELNERLDELSKKETECMRDCYTDVTNR